MHFRIPIEKKFDCEASSANELSLFFSPFKSHRRGLLLCFAFLLSVDFPRGTRRFLLRQHFVRPKLLSHRLDYDFPFIAGEE